MPSKAPSLPDLDGRVPSRPRRHSVLPDHARHPVPLPCPSPISALLPVQMFPVPSLEVPTEPGCRAKHGTSPAGPRRVVFLPVQGVTCLPQHVTSAHCMIPIRLCVVAPPSLPCSWKLHLPLIQSWLSAREPRTKTSVQTRDPVSRRKEPLLSPVRADRLVERNACPALLLAVACRPGMHRN